MKRALSIWAAALFCLTFLLVPSHAAQAAAFSDVSENHWARNAIEKMSALGVVNGYNGRFRPDDPVTRAELATILNNLLKFPTQTYSTFTDIKPGDWFYESMAALARQNIFLDSETTAGPNVKLTRQETAYIIAKAFALNPSSGGTSFTDNAMISDWALGYVSSMCSKKFISGMPDGSFKPENPVTRAQMCVMINNMVHTVITQPGVYNIPEETNILVTSPGVDIAGHSIKYLFIAPSVAQAGGTVRVNASGMEKSETYIFGAKNEKELYNKPRGAIDVGNTVVKELKSGIDTRFAGGAGSAMQPFLIENETQLGLIAEYMDKNSAYYMRNASFKLIKDVELTSPWTPVDFYGTFDGSGKTISNIDINVKIDDKNACVGFFAEIGATAMVKDLKLEGSVNVTDDSGITKTLNVGGFAGGISGGTVTGCEADMKITADVPADSSVGVMFGRIAGKSVVSGCVSSGTVIVVSKPDDSNDAVCAGGFVGSAAGTVAVTDCGSSASVAISGGNHTMAGGFAGYTNSQITRCYALGDVFAGGGQTQNDAGGFVGQTYDGTSISACWCAGNVRAEGEPVFFNMTGGFVGGFYHGTIKDCYAKGDVYAENALLGGFAGRFGAQMINCYSTSKASEKHMGEIVSGASLIGAGFGSGETATYCGDFLDSTDSILARPLFYDDASHADGSIESVTIAQILGSEAYVSRGWDFDTVWIMPDKNDTYKLPVLRGVYEDLQRAAAMPGHLNGR